VIESFPAIELAHLDLAGCEQSPEKHRHRLWRGQHGLRLDAAAELLVQPFDGIRGPSGLPLRRRQAGKGEETIAGFFQAVRCLASAPMGQI